MSARQAGAVDAAGFPEARTRDATARCSTVARHRQELRRHQGGARRQLRDAAIARLHALIGPNGAGKTTAFNLISGMFTPDTGHVRSPGATIAGLPPEAITRAGIGRSFQITNLFPALIDRGERPPRRAGARPAALQRLDVRPLGSTTSTARPRRCIRPWASPASRRPKPARCPTAASACSTWRWRSRPSRACCCSTNRSPASPPPSASASAT